MFPCIADCSVAVDVDSPWHMLERPCLKRRIREGEGRYLYVDNENGLMGGDDRWYRAGKNRVFRNVNGDDYS